VRARRDRHGAGQHGERGARRVARVRPLRAFLPLSIDAARALILSPQCAPGLPRPRTARGSAARGTWLDFASRVDAAAALRKHRTTSLASPALRGQCELTLVIRLLMTDLDSMFGLSGRLVQASGSVHRHHRFSVLHYHLTLDASLTSLRALQPCNARRRVIAAQMRFQKCVRTASVEMIRVAILTGARALSRGHRR
jgi:hypothetical protein